jgi:adenylate kinase
MPDGSSRTPRAVIFLGPPGAGKGTQAKAVAGRFALAHISTGDMFRDHMSRNTPLGEQAKKFVQSGALVPDEVVLGMVGDRISQPDCRNGFVLDGFPRTRPQAEALAETLRGGPWGQPLVVYFAVDADQLLRRLTGRRTCKVGGEIYNIYDCPPKVPGRCDRDGGELFQRPDDREEVIRERLSQYQAQTRPLVDYYRGSGLLAEVNAMGSQAEVTGRVLQVMGRPPGELVK